MTTFIPRRINAKASKAGKTYWEIETDQGNATCFDYPIVQDIQANLGKSISNYDLERNEKGFINLRPAKNPNQLIQNLAQPIAQAPASLPVPQNSYAEARQSKDVSMFTSYAKDIFLKLCEHEFLIRTGDKAMGGNSPEEMMKQAVALVKQAKVSFERTEIFEQTKTA